MPAGFRDDAGGDRPGLRRPAAAGFRRRSTPACSRPRPRATGRTWCCARPRPDAVVFAPSMAAPPSYAACTLSRASTRRSWSGTARRSTACRPGSRSRRRRSTRRRWRPSCSQTHSSRTPPLRRRPPPPTDPGRRGAAAPHRAGGSGRVAPPRRFGAAGRRLAAGLPRRRVDRRRAGAARSHRDGGHGDAAEPGLRGRRRGSDRQRPRRALDRGWTRREGPADERSMRLALALHDLRACDERRRGHDQLPLRPVALEPRRRNHRLPRRFAPDGDGIPVSCTGDLPTALALVLARALSGRALYCEFYTPERETGPHAAGGGRRGRSGLGRPGHPVVVEPNDHYPGEHGAGTSLSFRLEPRPGHGVVALPRRRHVAARLGHR